MSRYFLGIFMIISTFVCANDAMVDQTFIYQQIEEKEPDAISFCIDGKIYLNLEKVSLTDRGIYVGSVAIPTLYSDELGCYYAGRVRRKWICCTRDCPNFRNIFRNESGAALIADVKD